MLFFSMLCRIIPTDSVPENANFGMQCPNVQDIELFENVNFVNDHHTVCPGSSGPPEKIFNALSSENEVYTIY